ncbi:MAG: hypothetical protein QNJ72_09040 [Pleurocapsa sp. MO_226.B13]|nr:hypothetical protein [Pleurocapsa sp. MO_226.B13]
MSKIQLSELNPAGSELFEDSENFMNELNDEEMGNVVGGLTFAQSGVGISATVTAVSNNGNTVNANTATNINSGVIAG